MDNGHNTDIVLNKKSPKPLWFGLFKWRRRWDSNPRYARTYDGFQDRSNQPLWHSSKVIQLVTESILHKTYFFVKGSSLYLIKHAKLINSML